MAMFDEIKNDQEKWAYDQYILKFMVGHAGNASPMNINPKELGAWSKSSTPTSLKPTV